MTRESVIWFISEKLPAWLPSGKDHSEDLAKRYVDVPGMKSICKAISSRPGMEAKFGVTVAKLEWSREGGIWDLRGLQGESIGHYDAVVASDKNMASSRFTAQTGLPPPLGVQSVAGVEAKFGVTVAKVEWSSRLQGVLQH